jgi:hypothetical protein
MDSFSIRLPGRKNLAKSRLIASRLLQDDVADNPVGLLERNANTMRQNVAQEFFPASFPKGPAASSTASATGATQNDIRVLKGLFPPVL